jgi:hypothetical protein
MTTSTPHMAAFEQLTNDLDHHQAQSVLDIVEHAMKVQEDRPGVGWVAIASVLFRDFPDGGNISARLAAAVDIGVGLTDHQVSQHPVPDSPEGLEP